MITEIDSVDLAATLKTGAKLIDVREADELEEGAIPGYTHCPLSELDQFKDQLKAADPAIVFYCRSGRRSLKAAELAKEWGVKAKLYSLRGGFLAYQESDLG